MAEFGGILLLYNHGIEIYDIAGYMVLVMIEKAQHYVDFGPNGYKKPIHCNVTFNLEKIKFDGDEFPVVSRGKFHNRLGELCTIMSTEATDLMGIIDGEKIVIYSDVSVMCVTNSLTMRYYDLQHKLLTPKKNPFLPPPSSSHVMLIMKQPEWTDNFTIISPIVVAPGHFLLTDDNMLQRNTDGAKFALVRDTVLFEQYYLINGDEIIICINPDAVGGILVGLKPGCDWGTHYDCDADEIFYDGFILSSPLDTYQECILKVDGYYFNYSTKDLGRSIVKMFARVPNL
jgi:hypothetical protein